MMYDNYLLLFYFLNFYLFYIICGLVFLFLLTIQLFILLLLFIQYYVNVDWFLFIVLADFYFII